MADKDTLFRASGVFLVALILVSIFSGVPFGLIGGNVASAQAVVAIKTSRDDWKNIYNNMDFSVTVTLASPADENITIRVTVKGTTYLINATREAGTLDYVSVFRVTSDGELVTLYGGDGIAPGTVLASLSDKDVVTFQFGDKETSLTYDHVGLDVDLRTNIPYRINMARTSEWTFEAPDLNKNFDAIDRIVVHAIFRDITHDNETLLYILAEETEDNSGKFKPVMISSTDFNLPVVNETAIPAGTDNVIVTNESIVEFKSGVRAFNGKLFNVSLGLELQAFNYTNNVGEKAFNVSIKEVNLTIADRVFNITDFVMPLSVSNVTFGTNATFAASALGFSLVFNVTVDEVSGKNVTKIFVEELNVDLSKGSLWFLLFGVTEDIGPEHVLRLLFHAPPFTGETDVTKKDEVIKDVTVFREAGSFVEVSATISKLKVVVKDANANKDVLAKERIDVRLTMPVDKSSRTITLVETDKDTGVFEAEVSILANLTTGFNRTSRTLALEYNDVDEGVTVTEDVKVEFDTAEVSVSPKEVVFGAGVLTITLKDNDLNVDPDTAEIRRFGLGPGDEFILFVNVSDGDNRVLGELMVLAVNESHKMPIKVAPGASVILLLIETGKDTGEFTMNISLKDFTIPTSNTEKLVVLFKDYYTEELEILNRTADVEGRQVKLEVDRDVVPASLKNVKIKITVEDPSKNVDEFARDFVDVTVALYNITGDLVISNDSVRLTETGINTGMFEGVFEVPSTKDWFGDPRNVVGGKLVISYTSPAGSDKVELDIEVSDATLSVNVTQVKFGDIIEVMVNDPDSNIDTEVADKLNVTVRFVVDGTADSKEITLTETDKNSGIFKATLVVAKDGDIFSDPGTQITFSYTDETSSVTSHADTEWREQTVAQSVAVSSFTGEIQTPEAGAEFQPFAKFKVTIKDQDANVNAKSKDKVGFSIRLPDGNTVPLIAEETDVSSGVFEKEVSIPNDITATPEDLVGETIQIIYQDKFTPAGVQNIIVNIRIVAFDGEISLDKESYNVGDVVKVTVRDPDANRDPDKVDTVTVKVTSTSDPVGPPPIVLRETGKDTGEFVGLIVISDNPADLGATGKIFARVGDTITVTYTDKLPADYPAVKSISVSATARVGVFVEKPVQTEEVKPVDPQTGQEVTPKVGETVFIQVRVRNTDPVERTFIVIVQILDPDGVPVSVQFQQVTLAPGEERVLGFGFTPQAAGDYTVQVFIFRSLDDQTPLGEKTEQSVTVEE